MIEFYRSHKKEFVTKLVGSGTIAGAEGLKAYAQCFITMATKHGVERIVAYAAMIVAVATQEHEKRELVSAVIRAFIQLRPSERENFIESCQNGIDISTLTLIAELEELEPEMEAPGVRALDRWIRPKETM